MNVSVSAAPITNIMLDGPLLADTRRGAVALEVSAPMDTKVCAFCGGMFARTTEESYHWRIKQFCSKSCRSKFRFRLRVPLRCLNCGQVIVTRGLHKKYCSPECYHSAYTGRGSVDHRGRARARRIYTDGQPCEVCGAPYEARPGGTDRHHRNSNRLDNSPENVAFLCRKCHKQAHRTSDGKVGGGPRPRIVALMRDRALVRFAEAKRLRAQGLTNRQIATRMSVNEWSVPRWFHKYEDR